MKAVQGNRTHMSYVHMSFAATKAGVWFLHVHGSIPSQLTSWPTMSIYALPVLQLLLTLLYGSKLVCN